MTHVFWDTNLFIYLLDAHSQFRTPVSSLRQKMLVSGSDLVTSTMTLGEVMTGPRRHNHEPLAQQYKSAITQVATIVPLDERAADIYSSIRASHRVKPPDAIQLACAAAYGVELFVTNDEDLHKLRIPGIHFIVSIQTALQLIH
ncbi:MAG: type II toxin-antitoxin system VapC family toxin [Acidobacteria bacterium]|nr:type II toxin-antitoxin system VapC family toxin [Acidobacteriota bacterium]